MTINYAVYPSVNRPGYYNVFVPGVGKGFMSVDPNGNISYGPTNIDQNFQQFKRNGLAVEIAPGDDQNPAAVTYVVLPE